MLANLWRNLTTMARLIKEATLAAWAWRSLTPRVRALKGEA